MECPCKTCGKRGCGKAHDTCPEYQEWAMMRALANARRSAQNDIKDAIVNARYRMGKRKK